MVPNGEMEVEDVEPFRHPILACTLGSKKHGSESQGFGCQIDVTAKAESRLHLGYEQVKDARPRNSSATKAGASSVKCGGIFQRDPDPRDGDAPRDW